MSIFKEIHVAFQNNKVSHLQVTHLVPATFAIVMWLCSSGNNNAKPKSAILGLKSLSSKTLLAFMSR